MEAANKLLLEDLEQKLFNGLVLFNHMPPKEAADLILAIKSATFLFLGLKLIPEFDRYQPLIKEILDLNCQINGNPIDNLIHG